MSASGHEGARLREVTRFQALTAQASTEVAEQTSFISALLRDSDVPEEWGSFAHGGTLAEPLPDSALAPLYRSGLRITRLERTYVSPPKSPPAAGP